MQHPSAPIASTRRVRALDAWTIADGRVSGRDLMEAAGLGAFGRLSSEIPHHPVKEVIVLCGKGNNGGDGFVVGRHCQVAGIATRLLCTVPLDLIQTDDARTQARLCAESGLPIESASPSEVEAALAESGIIVDGLLGTGVQGNVRPADAEFIRLINAASAPTLCLDIPSGLCGDTGQVLGAAVRGTWTTTFGALKPGLLEPDASEWVGEVSLVPLPYPDEAWDAVTEPT